MHNKWMMFVWFLVMYGVFYAVMFYLFYTEDYHTFLGRQ